MFCVHDRLNLPTFIHVSLNSDGNQSPEHFRLPVTFRLDNPTLERISIKKLKCVEKGYEYPSIDIVFIRGDVTLRKNLDVSAEDRKKSGFYQSVQTISRVGSQELESFDAYSDESEHLEKEQHSLNGYLIFAYKTMEDMHTKKFTDSWKTWSGARMLCTRMPLPHVVTKLSFYRRVCGELNFEYILLAKIKNMMINAAPALNVLHYMKPKVCAYVGAYRRVIFEVSPNLCKSVGLVKANFANALTSRFRVTYSNNTGYVELSKNIEFRCREEEEEQLAKMMKKERTKVCVEVQTEPYSNGKKTKRCLPKTLSSIPVPGTSDCFTNFEEIYKSLNSIPTTKTSMNNILENKNHIVTIGNNSLLVLDNYDDLIDEQLTNGFNGNIKPTLQSKKLQNNQLNCAEIAENEIKTRFVDDGALLRRLKTEYFHSEEYTSAELCQL